MRPTISNNIESSFFVREYDHSNSSVPVYFIGASHGLYSFHALDFDRYAIHLARFNEIIYNGHQEASLIINRGIRGKETGHCRYKASVDKYSLDYCTLYPMWTTNFQFSFQTIGVPTNENLKYLSFAIVNTTNFSIKLTDVSNFIQSTTLYSSETNGLERKTKTPTTIAYITEKDIFYATFVNSTNKVQIIAKSGSYTSSGTTVGTVATLDLTNLLEQDRVTYVKTG